MERKFDVTVRFTVVLALTAVVLLLPTFTRLITEREVEWAPRV